VWVSVGVSGYWPADAASGWFCLETTTMRGMLGSVMGTSPTPGLLAAAAPAGAALGEATDAGATRLTTGELPAVVKPTTFTVFWPICRVRGFVPSCDIRCYKYLVSGEKDNPRKNGMRENQVKKEKRTFPGGEKKKDFCSTLFLLIGYYLSAVF